MTQRKGKGPRSIGLEAVLSPLSTTMKRPNPLAEKKIQGLSTKMHGKPRKKAMKTWKTWGLPNNAALGGVAPLNNGGFPRGNQRVFNRFTQGKKGIGLFANTLVPLLKSHAITWCTNEWTNEKLLTTLPGMLAMKNESEQRKSFPRFQRYNKNNIHKFSIRINYYLYYGC